MPVSPSVLVYGLIPEIPVQVMKEDFTGENRYYRNGGPMIAVSHIWGSRRFQTRDTSTNNWWVALVRFGDGWHNNHHAYPLSARHGLKRYEIDFNWYSIWILQQFGLVSHIRRTESPAGKHPGKPLATVE
jgi:hypothetical protein